jgi:hypothetical protein
MMKRYLNLDGNSGVVAYECRADSISVEFTNGTVYLYTHASAGSEKIDAMKQLAAAGRGLSSFIARHAHDAWESRLR